MSFIIALFMRSPKYEKKNWNIDILNSWLVLSRNTNSKTIQLIKSRSWELIKKGTSPGFKSARFPKLQMFVKIFCKNFTQPRMEPPCWCSFVMPPENSVCNLLWVTRRLILCTEQTSIYISTYPNTLTFKMAKYHGIRIYFWQTRS